MKTWALAVFILLGISCHSVHYYSVKDDTVIFYLNLPGAENVYFAHSLDDYIHHNVMADKNGRREFAVTANFEFRYFYIVDGSVYLPECEFRESDDFGFENCIFVPKW